MRHGEDPVARTAVVLTGGEPVAAERVMVPPDAFVVAADSGLHHAEALGLNVDLVVGDFDSVSPEALARAEQAGVQVERHSAAKDATDLELALLAARERGCREAIVVGGGGGRLDHLIAGLLVLASPALRDMHVRAITADASIAVVTGEAMIDGPVGSLVTLLAVGGAAEGVVTEGLEFPLRNERLDPLSTRGVSNVITHSPAFVQLRSGVLLVIQPEDFPK